MELDYTWRGASGFRKEACFFVGYRSPKGEPFRPEQGDSWLFSYEGINVRTYVKKAGWITDTWCSPGGRGYATDADGFVYSGPAGAAGWGHNQLDGVLTGVWGLDEQHVFVWGERAGSIALFYRWDGSRWQSAPAPERPIVELHGLAPDLLVGVGDKGFITRWDGSRWHTMQSPDASNLSTVFVAAPDEIYAAGHSGALHTGSVHGWSSLVKIDEPIPAVAKWHDRVWVATFSDRGLCTLDGPALTPVKPNLLVSDLDARGTLVFTTGNRIGDTVDGAAWTAYSTVDFINATSNEPPLWE
ncbi:MAG: hypothetical protein K8H88_22015 [Sandaracinaceae bacterium]|nr:hypothetical protein [Sandaracinaceae bacterium]